MFANYFFNKSTKKVCPPPPTTGNPGDNMTIYCKVCSDFCHICLIENLLFKFKFTKNDFPLGSMLLVPVSQGSRLNFLYFEPLTGRTGDFCPSKSNL